MAGNRRLTIEIFGDAKHLGGVFGETEGKLSRFSRGVGAAAVAGGAALAGFAVAGGAALISIGSTFDEMSDTIRVGTGATGDALAALEASAKAVATTVPASFEDAGQAIADVNTRLGLTGDDLEMVSSQFLEMARITGGDLTTAITNGTRVLGDWSVAVEDMPGALDMLFRASQATGISTEKLSDQLVKYGAPLRQMGFGFEEAAAILGKFEKEGVNAELVMGSMRQALGKLARSGEDPVETFARITDEIANAGSTSEANALALELFGARAGPDMAAAIREGRFELGELYDLVQGGSETILQAAEDTNSWQQSWTLFKNKAMVAIAPLAERAFGALGDGLDRVGPYMERFATELSERLPGAMAKAQQWIETNLLPAFEAIAGWVQAHWPQIQETVTTAVEAIGEVISAVIDAALAFWEQFGDEILALVEEVWPEIQQYIQGTLDVISGIFEAFAALFRGDWSALWDAAKQIFTGAWDQFTALLGIGLDTAQAIFSGAWDRINGIASDAMQAIIDGVAAVPGALLDLVGAFFSAAASLGQSVMDGLVGALSSTAGFAGDVGQAVLQAVKSLINTQVIDRINSALEFSVGLGPLGSISINPPDIPHLALGGIVTRPTLALVGEAGPEAVIPLSKASRRMAGIDGGGGPIYLTVEVGGEVIARKVIDQLNRMGGGPVRVRAAGL